MARVLVVDDSRTMLDVVKNELVRLGHEVETAADAQQALTRARAGAFDLALLDKNLPGMTGLQLISALRREPGQAGLKVIMCTASGMLADVQNAFQAGADDYLV